MHQMINFEILKSRPKLLTLLSTTGSIMQVVKLKRKPSNCFCHLLANKLILMYTLKTNQCKSYQLLACSTYIKWTVYEWVNQYYLFSKSDYYSFKL